MLNEISATESWSVRAWQFLNAANTLLHSPDYGDGKALMVPTLHMTGHGIELLLKANLIANDLPVPEAEAFGHQLLPLWNHDRNEMLRAHARIEGRLVWERARLNPRFKGNFAENPDELMLEYLEGLADLHGKASGYALRYPVNENDGGPRPYLLTETFFEVADLNLKQPTSLKLGAIS